MSIFGLWVGSFLTVIIYRLPLVLEAQWQAEASVLAEALPAPTRFSLLMSHLQCPHCKHALAWHECLPVVSYLKQRGRCLSCRAPIGRHYPLVELAIAMLFGYCGWVWGATPTALVWSGFCAALVTLAVIDWRTMLLPDDITLPLLWAGLVASAQSLTSTHLNEALWGAVAGYLSLWLVYWTYMLVTGKEGMGYGDFKLLAALGAWLGWQALIPLVLLASLSCAAVGLALKARNKLFEGHFVPFGPFLAGSGMVILITQKVV